MNDSSKYEVIILYEFKLTPSIYNYDSKYDPFTVQPMVPSM